MLGVPAIAAMPAPPPVEGSPRTRSVSQAGDALGTINASTSLLASVARKPSPASRRTVSRASMYCVILQRTRRLRHLEKVLAEPRHDGVAMRAIERDEVRERCVLAAGGAQIRVDAVLEFVGEQREFSRAPGPVAADLHVDDGGAGSPQRIDGAFHRGVDVGVESERLAHEAEALADERVRFQERRVVGRVDVAQRRRGGVGRIRRDEHVQQTRRRRRRCVPSAPRCPA